MSDLSVIASNIRFYRKKQGMTQSDLAEKMNVSFQAVSGWETGNTVPDILNFCRLTEILKVSADSLLTPMNQDGSYFIGIDGGGTKTEFALCSSTGNVITSFRLGATNPDTDGLDSACNILREGIEKCLQTGLPVHGIFAGVAGGYQDQICAFIQSRFPKIPFRIDSDAVNILAAVQCDIGLICGTGSIVLVREEGNNHFLGGWGHMVGDPGSGFNIGRQAMIAGLQMEEQTGPDTLIRSFLCERLGISTEKKLFDQIDEVFAKGTPFVASLATTVFLAANMGDKVAHRILEEEIEALINQVNVGLKKYDCGNRVAAAGGVLEHNRELLLPFLKKFSKADTEFVFSDLPPIFGACTEACTHYGVALDEKFHDNFKTTYARIN